MEKKRYVSPEIDMYLVKTSNSLMLVISGDAKDIEDGNDALGKDTDWEDEDWEDED